MNKNTDNWDRDYVYYNIDQTNDKGRFRSEYIEILGSFIFGDYLTMPNLAAPYRDLILDSPTDPEEPIWTDGSCEFMVKTIVSGTNGVGEELIHYFMAEPGDLFGYDIWWSGPSGSVSITNTKLFDVDLPLFSWDLAQYSSTIKMSIEEVDPSSTRSYIDESTTSYASNFELVGGDITKIGAKFGASGKQNKQYKVTRTISDGNDFLGEVIINFGDKYFINDELLHFGEWEYMYYTPFTYYSGTFSINLYPALVY